MTREYEMHETETCRIRVSTKFCTFIDDIRGDLSRAEMIDLIYLTYIASEFNKEIKLKV